MCPRTTLSWDPVALSPRKLSIADRAELGELFGVISDADGIDAFPRAPNLVARKLHEPYTYLDWTWMTFSRGC